MGQRLILGGLALGSVLVALMAAELVFRWQYQSAHGVPFMASIEAQYDAFGWQGAMVHDARPGRPTVFVLGDSLTAGFGIAPGERYPGVMGALLDVDVITYGGGGYGTLQESMVLDKYLTEVRPTLVVLQVCSNDFINNSWDLERATLFNSNLRIRPYLIGNEIEYRYPSRVGAQRLFLARHSRLALEIINGVDRWRADLARRGYLNSIENDIGPRGLEVAPFREAVEITRRLLDRIQKRAGSTPLVAMLAEDGDVYSDQWRRLFREQSLPYCDVSERIRSAKTSGAPVYLADGAHWNSRGHEVVGIALADCLRTLRGGMLAEQLAPLRDRKP